MHNRISESKVPITVKELRSKIILPAKYMSSAKRDVKSTEPMVGRSITTETMIKPEIIKGSCQPMVLRMGLIATRTGNLNKRVLSQTPLARAV